MHLRISLAFLVSVCLVSAVEAKGPNIVFILADDVGQEVLGCYGGTSYETPHLDALAAGGIRFRHGYSMPTCHPSRLCLLTGRYPFRFGTVDWGTFPKAAEPQTFAHVLKSAGYQTAIAGKWQLCLLGRDLRHPHKLGFDEYSLFGWHEGPRYHQPLIWQNGRQRDDVRDRYGPDVYCDDLIDFMTRNRERPFFAFYSMTLCHSVSDDFDQPVPFAPNGRYESYQELVDSMDRHVGRLVAALDRLGLRENTLIVFTGDNGTMKEHIVGAEQGRLIREDVVSRRGETLVPGGKGELTDGGTRVPLIVNWQGTVPAGRVLDDLIDFSDFLPTFAQLAGASLPKGVALDGHSFARLLQGRARPPRTWVHAEHKGKHWVRNQRWKLYDDGRLYDLDSDPGETQAVDPGAESDEAQAVRADFAAVLHELLGGNPPPP